MKYQPTLDTLFKMQLYPLAVAPPTPIMIQTVTPAQQTVTVIEEPQTCADINADGLECETCPGDIHDCRATVDAETVQIMQETHLQSPVPFEELAQPLNTEDPQLVAMLKKPIAMLKGLYTVVKMPTEERLTVRFEGLNEESWEKLTDIAEAHMKMVDEKYCVRNTRGRNWEGAGHGVENRATQATTESSRILRFKPFPSSTVNIFKTMRKMRSDAYHEHCVVLERQEESFQNNINILPYSDVLDFNEKVKELDAKIDDVNKAIADFLQTEDWTNLLQTLEPYGVADYLRKKKWTVEHCYVLSTDIALDTATVKQHIENEYQKAFTNIDEYQRKAIDDFEDGQMRTRRSLAEEAIESLRGQLNELVQRVVASSQRQPERVKADLERLRRRVVSIGLAQLEPTVTQIMEVFDKPERALELFGRKDVAGAVDERIDALVNSLE